MIGTMAQHSLTELDAVLMVARRGKFRAAAVELGVSTTSLSNAVAKLERALGVRLFNRTTRSVSLTEAGHRFVDQIAQQRLALAADRPAFEFAIDGGDRPAAGSGG